LIKSARELQQELLRANNPVLEEHIEFLEADLADPALQGARTDEDLANAIVRGKGRMPAFGNQLRPEAVPMLVRFVRSLRR